MFWILGGNGQLVQLSKTFTYNTDGTLATATDSAGTKSFIYSNGYLVSLVGTGVYRSKTFTYNSLGQLIDLTVL